MFRLPQNHDVETVVLRTDIVGGLGVEGRRIKNSGGVDLSGGVRSSQILDIF